MISIPDFQSAAKEFRAGKIDIKAFTQLVFEDSEPSSPSPSLPKSGRDTKKKNATAESISKEKKSESLSGSDKKKEKQDTSDRLPGDGLCIDEQREQRCGFPEVIFGEGKTESQIQKAARKLLSKNQDVLVTRLSDQLGSEIAYHFPTAIYQPLAGTLRISAIGNTKKAEEITSYKNEVAIVAAGTSDQKVAIEVQETLAWMGVGAQLIMDVGVAGPDRLVPHLPFLKNCKAVIVVAGMDGALASVVGGHLSCPVFCVPTSVGYGSCFGGVAPLLSMLNSCASNVVPVNIDAGFKAAYLTGVMLETFRNK